ncbi:MAG: hypothetical protein R2799_10255 [Crocinitomicaceae bacterium]
MKSLHLLAILLGLILGCLYLEIIREVVFYIFGPNLLDSSYLSLDIILILSIILPHSILVVVLSKLAYRSNIDNYKLCVFSFGISEAIGISLSNIGKEVPIILMLFFAVFLGGTIVTISLLALISKKKVQ